MKVHALLATHGENVRFDAEPTDDLACLRLRALAASKRPSSRPAEEWEIRDARGVCLDPGSLVRDTPTIHFPGGYDGQLFFVLRATASTPADIDPSEPRR